MLCTSRRRLKVILIWRRPVWSEGCHVYVEKPFTVWADEAEKLIAIANERIS